MKKMGAKIALGFGNNIDYEIVWNSKIIEALITKYNIQAGEINSELEITSERHLVVSILYFLQLGSGGERFVAEPMIVEQFVERFQKKSTLGGTSVRAAVVMHKLGQRTALHLVTKNDDVRRLIPPYSAYVSSNSTDTVYPHLIVQFDQGTRVKANDIYIEVPRANRIIYHHDIDNIAMNLNPNFGKLITESQVLLISGFNAMQSEELLSKRLRSLAQILTNLPQGALIFYEDAGFYDSSLGTVLYPFLARYAHVFSLNEDELQSHIGRKIDVLDPHQVSEALADLYYKIPIPTIVVHTMYWALAYGNGASLFADALQGGTTMATTRFCYGDEFTLTNYKEVGQLPYHTGGARFAVEIRQLLGNNVCCIAVARVAQRNATTIGLGDAFVGGFLEAFVAQSSV